MDLRSQAATHHPTAHRRFVLIESERATETEMSMAAQKRWQRRWKQNVRAFVSASVCMCAIGSCWVHMCVCCASNWILNEAFSVDFISVATLPESADRKLN